jgi:hypothetical protein
LSSIFKRHGTNACPKEGKAELHNVRMKRRTKREGKNQSLLLPQRQRLSLCQQSEATSRTSQKIPSSI